jgi:hypothetical protein
MVRISDATAGAGATPGKLPFDINRGMGNIKTAPLVSYDGAPSGDPQLGTATDAAPPPAPLASGPQPDKASLLKKLFRIQDPNASTPRAAVPQPPTASVNALYEAKKKDPASQSHSHSEQHKLSKRIDTSA